MRLMELCTFFKVHLNNVGLAAPSNHFHKFFLIEINVNKTDMLLTTDWLRQNTKHGS